MATPHPRVNVAEITERNNAARHVIAGFSAQMPALAGIWRDLDTALADNTDLAAELTRLSTELRDTRLDRANLLAAARAALAARADGETDPLWYLRDELNARQVPSQRHGRPS